MFNILIGLPSGLVTFVVNVLASPSLIFILIAIFIGENKYSTAPGATMEYYIMVKLNNQMKEENIARRIM